MTKTNPANASRPDIELPAHKLHRLLAYVENLGLDPAEITRAAGLDMAQIPRSGSSDTLPSLYYALIYKETVSRLQQDQRQVPWAAGLGSDSFRLMCYCLITCRTLGEALDRAQQFDALLFPLVGRRIEVQRQGSQVILNYVLDQRSVQRAVAPANWTMEQCEAVARSSGLQTWFGLCGWLIGRRVDVKEATLIGAPASLEQAQRLRQIFQCPVHYEWERTAIVLPSRVLQHRLVHSARSLEKFLDTGPHQLWSGDDKVVSTSSAAASLMGGDFSDGLPSLEALARQMHMSASTLRRHLLAEGTSYQKIKDERRRDLSIELLCLSDARISTIGEQVGFADTSSFVRSFRAWTGTTPKAYRDKHRGLRLS